MISTRLRHRERTLLQRMVLPRDFIPGILGRIPLCHAITFEED